MCASFRWAALLLIVVTLVVVSGVDMGGMGRRQRSGDKGELRLIGAWSACIQPVKEVRPKLLQTHS